MYPIIPANINAPIVIAAIVIVIISRGIPSRPIIPKIKKAAIKLGTTPIREILIFLNISGKDFTSSFHPED